MRILHLVHQYPPHHIGGTELYTQNLARRQALAGHNVAVFAPVPETSPPAKVLSNGVRVYGVPTGERSRLQVFYHSFRQPSVRRALQEVIEHERPDLVHVQHLMGLPLGLIEDLRQARVPYVVTLHDYWYVCANAQLVTNTDQSICAGPDAGARNCARCALARAGLPSAGGLAPLAAPIFRNRNQRLRDVLAGAARVIAPTQFVYKTYEQLGIAAANMSVVRHGIELPEAAVREARAAHVARPRGGPLRVGYVGSVAWQKGLHVLIDAVNELPPDDVQLTIYGGLDGFPDYVAALEASIRHRSIRLAGRVAREDLWQALAALDVVVLPTLWYEASPLTIDEVFAVGVPIVASQIGAMTEKIANGVNGYLFPPAAPLALSQILQTLQAEPGRLERLEGGIGPVRTLAEHMVDVENIYRSAL